MPRKKEFIQVLHLLRRLGREVKGRAIANGIRLPFPQKP